MVLEDNLENSTTINENEEERKLRWRSEARLWAKEMKERYNHFEDNDRPFGWPPNYRQSFRIPGSKNY